MAPHTRAVGYAANRKDLRGEAATLMLWGGSGEPREVLRVHDPEHFRLVGWTPDGLNLLIIRWSFDSVAGRRVGNEAFNAGWKRVEHWVMENALPK